MRTTTPRSLPLFRSEAQLRMLALLLLEPDTEWTMADLAARVGLPMASTHRELRRAEEAGLLERDTRARPHRFRAATASPLFEPLRELLSRTVGAETQLRELFADREGIVAAAIHGSWASGRVRPDSDIDVIAVGTEAPTAVRRDARALGKRVGRRIDVTLYRPDEFAQKAADGNGFLRLALERPLIPLKGDLTRLA